MMMMTMNNTAQVVQQCSGPVAPGLMALIVAHESGGHPWAINVNGLSNGSMTFPNKPLAVATATHYIRLGYKVDMGLAQVDSENLGRLGLSISQAFSPCTNVKAGAAIFSGAWKGAQAHGFSGGNRLMAALSAYNSGNYRGDWGYADAVLHGTVVGGAIPYTQAYAGVVQKAGPSPFMASPFITVSAPPIWMVNRTVAQARMPGYSHWGFRYAKEND
jgi:type IV secretion system protein VirB1